MSVLFIDIDFLTVFKNMFIMWVSFEVAEKV